MTKTQSAIIALSFILTTSSFAATKGYQVTGPVVDVTATTITIKKGKDNWVMARTPNTKGLEGVKPGDKVTVYYSMTAEEVETKPAKKK